MRGCSGGVASLGKAEIARLSPRHCLNLAAELISMSCRPLREFGFTVSYSELQRVLAVVGDEAQSGNTGRPGAMASKSSVFPHLHFDDAS